MCRMAGLDPSQVHKALRRLSTARPAVFGANRHYWVLNESLPETEVSAFERFHRVSLPSDYREFLTRIGNGGAGPFYGVFPLGQMDGTAQLLKEWHENDGFVGVLSEPFPLRDAWNDLSGMPPEELLDSDEDEYFRRVGAFDEKTYWHSSRMNGAIPICHIGCALRIWLVVTGDEAVNLWRDGRADRTGLSPLTSQTGSRTTFSPWYDEWLQGAIRMLR